MKNKLPIISKIFALATASIICASGTLHAQEKKKPAAAPAAKPAKKSITYAELKKNLSIDPSPISSTDGRIVSYAPMLEKAMPAVVTIYASKTNVTRNPQQEEMFRRMFPDIPEGFFEKHGEELRKKGGNKQKGVGSGVVIDGRGYIITNSHVVNGADEIVVLLSGSKKRYDAKVIGLDPQSDVALIKIEAKGLKTITIADSSTLRVGDIAFAIGNPLGLEQTATHGIISALGRSGQMIMGSDGYEDFIQTDASVNRGNSGGALVDANGRLIGINTAIQSTSGGSMGIAFAIPSNMAMTTVRRLLDGDGTVHRGFLGVYLKDPDPELAKALGRKEQSGVVVIEVGPGTPAEKHGMKAGDLIIGYNGNDAESMAKLRLDISNTDPGTNVFFDIIRSGKQQKLDVVLGDLENRGDAFASTKTPKKKAAPPKPRELMDGVQIAELDKKVRAGLRLPDGFEGVLVKSVQDKSPAAKAGLRSGVVITMINQRDVSSVKQAYDLASKVDSDVLLLQVYANGRRDIVAIVLK